MEKCCSCVRRKRNTLIPYTRRSVNKEPQPRPPLCTSTGGGYRLPGTLWWALWQCGRLSAYVGLRLHCSTRSNQRADSGWRAPLHLSARLQLPTLLTVSGSQLARGVAKSRQRQLHEYQRNQRSGSLWLSMYQVFIVIVDFLFSFFSLSSALTQKCLQTQALVRTDSTASPCPRIIARTSPSIPGTTASSYYATQTAKV